jgi:hypothetical protein
MWFWPFLGSPRCIKGKGTWCSRTQAHVSFTQAAADMEVTTDIPRYDPVLMFAVFETVPNGRVSVPALRNQD